MIDRIPGQRLVVIGVALAGGMVEAAATELVTSRSSHPVAATIQRFEEAVIARGWVVFTRIDHAEAARAAGLELRPRTVIVFGNPKAGTGAMAKAPTLAIDLPLKALVWEDDRGVTHLTMNGADYLAADIYPRHGLAIPEDGRAGIAAVLEALSSAATR